MSLYRSLLCGTPGDYHLWGIQIRIIQRRDESRLTKALSWILQARFYTLIHELGHALAVQAVYDKSSFHGRQEIWVGPTGGRSWSPSSRPEWRRSVVKVAGPMSALAVCMINIIGCKWLRKSIPWPILLLIKGPAWFRLFYELGLMSIAVDEESDFGKIAEAGRVHLAAALSAVAAELSLGYFLYR